MILNEEIKRFKNGDALVNFEAEDAEVAQLILLGLVKIKKCQLEFTEQGKKDFMNIIQDKNFQKEMKRKYAKRK